MRLGLDIGGTKIEAVVIDNTGKLFIASDAQPQSRAMAIFSTP